MNDPYDNLRQLLAQQDLRLTNPRRKVFAVLHANDLPMSPREVHEQAPSIDTVSVYRTLALFTRLGITQTVPAGFKQKYELVDIFKPHHHHLQCGKCGELINIGSDEFETLINSIARKYGYTSSHHKFELTGLCSQCQATSL